MIEDIESQTMHLSVVKDIKDLESKIQYDSRKQALCPLCPEDKFKRASRHRLRRHFKSHQKISVVLINAGLMVLGCHLPCRKSSNKHVTHAHYHCPECTQVLARKHVFLGHIKICLSQQNKESTVATVSHNNNDERQDHTYGIHVTVDNRKKCPNSVNASGKTNIDSGIEGTVDETTTSQGAGDNTQHSTACEQLLNNITQGVGEESADLSQVKYSTTLSHTNTEEAGPIDDENSYFLNVKEKTNRCVVKHISIVRNIKDLESKIQYDSRKQALCPLCPEDKFKRAPPKRVKSHLFTHQKISVKIGGLMILGCHLPCRKSSNKHRNPAHYHCPHCSRILTRKGRFVDHLEWCVKKANGEPIVASSARSRDMNKNTDRVAMEEELAGECQNDNSSSPLTNTTRDKNTARLDQEEELVGECQDNSASSPLTKTSRDEFHECSDDEDSSFPNKHVSIVKEIKDLERKIKYDSRKKALCPVCPENVFKRAPLYRLKKHFISHQNNSVKIADYIVLGCHLPCRKSSNKPGTPAHYHCPMCDAILSRKLVFLGHVQWCQYKKDLQAAAAKGEELNIQRPPSLCRKKASVNKNAVCSICQMKMLRKNMRRHYQTEHKEIVLESSLQSNLYTIIDSDPAGDVQRQHSHRPVYKYVLCSICQMKMLRKNIRRHYQTEHKEIVLESSLQSNLYTIIDSDPAGDEQRQKLHRFTKVRCNICHLKMPVMNMKRHYEAKHRDPSTVWTTYMDYCTIEDNDESSDDISDVDESGASDTKKKKKKKKRKKQVRSSVRATCKICYHKMLKRNVKRHYELKHTALAAAWSPNDNFYSVEARVPSGVRPTVDDSSDNENHDDLPTDEHTTASNLLELFSLNQPQTPRVLVDRIAEPHVSNPVELSNINSDVEHSSVRHTLPLPGVIAHPNPLQVAPTFEHSSVSQNQDQNQASLSQVVAPPSPQPIRLQCKVSRSEQGVQCTNIHCQEAIAAVIRGERSSYECPHVQVVKFVYVADDN
ncbi:uncharacterized protein LOC144434338 [Glandiceps talaboti]